MFNEIRIHRQDARMQSPEIQTIVRKRPQYTPQELDALYRFSTSLRTARDEEEFEARIFKSEAN